jgi:hypothetical protein
LTLRLTILVVANSAALFAYTSEEWRSPAYAVRYFIGVTAVGVSVGLVAWLCEQGGFVTMLHAFAGLCLLEIAAAIILPTEIKVPGGGEPNAAAFLLGSACDILHPCGDFQ